MILFFLPNEMILNKNINYLTWLSDKFIIGLIFSIYCDIQVRLIFFVNINVLLDWFKESRVYA